ncbi:sporulation-specific chitinase 2 [Coccidioides immitis RMSCC 2394]|uniref:chitinase n=1 Tax=Coccidioides immitis RMSCC 2394 TaxID=404692 RepID=A0A0J7B4T6_COCIT|nr:sporulation-specific chitinase 2 [Coccidioides immitis RMSCC 2394]
MMFKYTGPTYGPWPLGINGATGQSDNILGPSDISIYFNAVYYPSWRIYKKQPPSSLRLGCVSHVFYAFAWVNPDGTVRLSDEWADDQMPVDGTQGCIRAFTQLKEQYTGMKVILSIGGGGTGSQRFATVAKDPIALQNFIQSAKNMVDRFGLDGLDIDWEQPSDSQQGEDYVNLLRLLREGLPWPQYTLTTALPAGEWALRHINLIHAQCYVDLINLMTYDFSGPWTPHSGHQSQLFSPHTPHSEAAGISCHSGISYVLAQGVPSSKILLGISVYGRAFPGTTGVGQTHCISNETPEDKIVFDYCDLPLPGSVEQHDDRLCAAFCVDRNMGFVSYDSTRTVVQKAKFVREMALGGLFYWHVAADAVGKRSLVAAGYSALHDL